MKKNMLLCALLGAFIFPALSWARYGAGTGLSYLNIPLGSCLDGNYAVLDGSATTVPYNGRATGISNTAIVMPPYIGASNTVHFSFMVPLDYRSNGHIVVRYNLTSTADTTTTMRCDLENQGWSDSSSSASPLTNSTVSYGTAVLIGNANAGSVIQSVALPCSLSNTTSMSGTLSGGQEVSGSITLPTTGTAGVNILDIIFSYYKYADVGR